MIFTGMFNPLSASGRADISAQGMFQVHFQSEVKVCIMQYVISLPTEVNLE